MGAFMPGFLPALADDIELDGQMFDVEEASAEDKVVAENVLNEQDAKISQYESFMLEMGWNTSNEDYRREIFEKISELKDALKQNLQELSDNLQDVQETEKSMENRILGGATIAATGLGGMQLAQGLAEQAADRAAEEDMNAYIATFKCSIGEKGPKNYNGGTKGITTPVLTQFTDLYQDYKKTAGQLKIRKEALGMTPGIEAELVLEAKDTDSLYDDVGHGIENGTQASLYRSLTGSADDANALNDQKETSATRVKGGAIATAAGVVAGIVGNKIINNGKGDKSKEILAKRQDIEQELTDVLQFEVDACNAKIQITKEWAAEQKTTQEYTDNPGLREWVAEIENMKLIDNIEQLKDHPICD